MSIDNRFSLDTRVQFGKMGAVGFLLFFSLPVGAQDIPETMESGLLWWMAGFQLVLGVAVSVVILINFFRPNPALHKQFAAVEHVHPDLVTKPELKESLNLVREELTNRLEEGARRDARTDAKLDAISTKISEGFSRTHSRIDPLAETLAATSKSLDTHLKDHRYKDSKSQSCATT